MAKTTKYSGFYSSVQHWLQNVSLSISLNGILPPTAFKFWRKCFPAYACRCSQKNKAHSFPWTTVTLCCTDHKKFLLFGILHPQECSLKYSENKANCFHPTANLHTLLWLKFFCFLCVFFFFSPARHIRIPNIAMKISLDIRVTYATYSPHTPTPENSAREQT